ncbi:TVP38/TMEM64 family protein [Halobaculum magnesiiphilum]|uniref:VTT domain-containing protein n=1 Tax=Halobaculum magnesiiphilum TaxID=1017351 RepID=A0A8T8WG58_9EURY|nr:VTT domain-containing protein [Halobaculum magnesiiphilum]QZP38766.1 VTT domain-containing protein [Halobaculum magnesiiphilum]
MNRRALVGGLVAGAVVVAAVLSSPNAVFDRIAWVTAEPWRLVAVLAALAVVRPLLAWPVTLLAVVAGYGLGLSAIPLSLAAMVTTSVPPYLFARRGRDAGDALAGGDRVSTAVNGLLDRAVGAGERAVSVAGGTRSVAASRLLPFPSDAVSVAAGLAGVRAGPFVLGSAVGELPWAIAGTVAGASAGRVAEVGLDGVIDPWLIGTAALGGLLLLAGPAYRHYRSASI